jgi:hypothetical protein
MPSTQPLSESSSPLRSGRPARRGVAALLALLLAVSMVPTGAVAKDSFRIAWSIYVGWMP